MIRRRQGPPPEESSSDEEDAFSAMSQKPKNAGNKASQDGSQANAQAADKQQKEGTTTQLPAANTSSMKRHHGTSGDRKAKMAALFQGLEADKESIKSGHHRPQFVPDKKGSFVAPGEEHLTSNIFVGNLDPTITEEEVTEVFRQFGDLYSVKIMWPRTPEERARNRNTGFVCFMAREDAEEAMDAFSETDPFRVGRRLMMRWGKNVKKIVKRGTGGVPIPPIRKKSLNEPQHENYRSKRRRVEDTRVSSSLSHARDSLRPVGDISSSSNAAQKHPDTPKYDPAIHARSAVRVQAPRNLHRVRFITTVASFVSKDGATLERKLIENQSGNPDFAFLTLDDADEIQKAEHIFYRWRVFAFCQGDGFDSWRTEPFVMTQPQGRFWIPPSLDHEAAWREKQAAVEREEQIRQRKEQRRRVGERKDFMTGRQLEQAKFGRAVAGASDGGAQLTEEELEQYQVLVIRKLCASREAICEAMAFCYDKSGAAKQISTLLKETLLDDSQGISVDTRIARLFLLSDVLFNSQQPGVRNAFLYRNAIEAMAPEIFASLGQHGKGRLGRMTLNKLKTAVGAVLSAWTTWSVYNPTFLDELHARFEGREVVKPEQEKEDEEEERQAESLTSPKEDSTLNDTVVIDKPRGGWTEVAADQPAEPEQNADVDGDALNANDGELGVAANVDGNQSEDDDLDGAELEEDDIDGEPLEDGDFDGEPISDDEVDGEALGDDDLIIH